MEIANYEKAKVLNKKIIGICRGAQLMTALNGGRLFQDISHYSGHIVEFENGKKVKLNSLHHQMCDPTPIKGARIIAWTDESGRSPFYYDGEDKQVAPPEKEAEIILFNQNELGIQCHPEMMSDHEEGKQEIVNLFEQFMNNTI
jgi:gamma-glutamyl-gamma-aminobutyrate hydrolase PuuD